MPDQLNDSEVTTGDNLQTLAEASNAIANSQISFDSVQNAIRDWATPAQPRNQQQDPPEPPLTYESLYRLFESLTDHYHLYRSDSPFSNLTSTPPKPSNTFVFSQKSKDTVHPWEEV